MALYRFMRRVRLRDLNCFEIRLALVTGLTSRLRLTWDRVVYAFCFLCIGSGVWGRREAERNCNPGETGGKPWIDARFLSLSPDYQHQQFFPVQASPQNP